MKRISLALSVALLMGVSLEAAPPKTKSSSGRTFQSIPKINLPKTTPQPGFTPSPSPGRTTTPKFTFPQSQRPQSNTPKFTIPKTTVPQGTPKFTYPKANGPQTTQPLFMPKQSGQTGGTMNSVRPLGQMPAVPGQQGNLIKPPNAGRFNGQLQDMLKKPNLVPKQPLGNGEMNVPPQGGKLKLPQGTLPQGVIPQGKRPDLKLPENLFVPREPEGDAQPQGRFPKLPENLGIKPLIPKQPNVVLPERFNPEDLKPRDPNWLPEGLFGDNDRPDAGDGNGGGNNGPGRFGDLVPDRIPDDLIPDGLLPDGGQQGQPEVDEPGDGQPQPGDDGNNDGGNNGGNQDGGQPDADPGDGQDGPGDNGPGQNGGDNHEDGHHGDGHHGGGHGHGPGLGWGHGWGQQVPGVIVDLICGNHHIGYCPPCVDCLPAPIVEVPPTTVPGEVVPALPRVENGDIVTLMLETALQLAEGVELRAVLIVNERPMLIEVVSAEPGLVRVELPTLIMTEDTPAMLLLGRSDTGDIVMQQPIMIVPIR